MALTKEQLIERQKGIGGSDVAAILGLSKWSDAIDIWKSKVSDQPIIKEESNLMKWGSRIEPLLAEDYSQETGNKIQYVENMLTHPEFPWLIAHVDRFFMNGPQVGILEIKTTGQRYMSGWKEELPMEYFCQVQHYMFVCKLTIAHVYILVRDSMETHWIPVEFDQKYHDMAFPLLKTFWEDHVLKNVPPEPKTGKEVEKIIAASSGKELDATPETYEIVKEYAEKDAAKKTLEARLAEIKDSIQLAMRESEILKYRGDTICTWKQGKDKKQFKKAELSQDYPALVEQYTEIVPGNRTFLNKIKVGE
jgi:putative phage-type endonuclease